MVGRSPALLALLRRIEMVAPTEATVLILGERGTGKELVADAIRDGSRRADGPLHQGQLCGASRRAARQRAVRPRAGGVHGGARAAEGLLAAAHGGTVFLDEIGDLSPAGQAMLLRFLQEREVRPIGVRQAYRVDVRVIAATNKDLERAIARGEFRADLYDRLREVVVEVPPLRERREDIPLLVEHFLQVASVRHGRPRPALGPEARRALLRYDWPGNVRELEQTLSAAVIFAGANPIQVWQLSLGPGRAVQSSSHGCELIQQGTAGRAGVPSRVAPAEAVGSGCVSDRQRMALQLVADTGAVSRLDLVRRLGVSRETARLELARLVAAGRLRRVGAAGRWVQYVRPD